MKSAVGYALLFLIGYALGWTSPRQARWCDEDEVCMNADDWSAAAIGQVIDRAWAAELDHMHTECKADLRREILINESRERARGH